MERGWRPVPRMSMIALTALTLVLSSAGLVAWLVRRHGWRWGDRPGAHVLVGPGAFRAAPTTSDGAPRGVPPAIVAASGVGLVWAALTFVVFSPAGLLLATMLSDQRDGAPAITLAFVCIDGFAVAAGLVIAAVALLRCRPGAHPRARRVAWWSGAHHVAVLAWFAWAALAHHDLAILGWVSIPCLFGVGHAILLHRAGAENEPEVPHRSSLS